MLYLFSQFKLDTDAVELSHNGQLIPLTKQNFELLAFFLENPNHVYSKDEIINTLWKGSIVNENTVDKSISKLRKILKTYQKEEFIKTIYGKGFKFFYEVKKQEPKKEVTAEINKSNQTQQAHSSASSRFNKIIIALAIVLIFAIIGVANQKKKPEEAIKEHPFVLILPHDTTINGTQKDDWLNLSSDKLLQQVFNFTNLANLKNYQDKPKFLGKEEYLSNQWQITPQLKVVSTNITKKNKLFEIEISITDRLKNIQSQKFRDKNLSQALVKTSDWLTKSLAINPKKTDISSLLPKDSYILELYMHGLASLSKNKFSQAEHFFQLCLNEQDDFVLARLQLAKIKHIEGETGTALAILETLEKQKINPQIDISIQNIKATIIDQKGNYQQAEEIFLKVLQKYQDVKYPQLDDIKYNLVFTYTRQTKFEKALKLLNQMESSIKETQKPELLADILQKKASILQKIGETALAESQAIKSLNVFVKLKDLIGEAKIHTTIARIKNHQAKFDESLLHLNKSLAICESLDYKLGIGATLNEIIYVLMTQGKFDKALQLNAKMESIATQIDYQAMIFTAKQFWFDINRSKRDYKKAQIYLHDYTKLAQESGDESALLKSKLFAIDLKLDLANVENIMPLFEEIQHYINKSGEKRLQPRLDTKKARFYLLKNDTKQALITLRSAKKLAKETEDGEILTDINNLLAEIYLKNKQYDKASHVLNESQENQPLPYPYLLLKSKLTLTQGNKTQALQLANECKLKSYQWWKLADEQYLQNLKTEQ